MESNFTGSKNLLDFSELNLPKYSVLITIFILLTMLILFLRKKLKSHMNNRHKLKEMAEDYERKRKSRKSLKVYILCNIVSFRLGNR
jgi:hypothetical protein